MTEIRPRPNFSLHPHMRVDAQAPHFQTAAIFSVDILNCSPDDLEPRYLVDSLAQTAFKDFNDRYPAPSKDHAAYTEGLFVGMARAVLGEFDATNEIWQPKPSETARKYNDVPILAHLGYASSELCRGLDLNHTQEAAIQLALKGVYSTDISEYDDRVELFKSNYGDLYEMLKNMNMSVGAANLDELLNRIENNKAIIMPLTDMSVVQNIGALYAWFATVAFARDVQGLNDNQLRNALYSGKEHISAYFIDSNGESETDPVVAFALLAQHLQWKVTMLGRFKNMNEEDRLKNLNKRAAQLPDYPKVVQEKYHKEGPVAADNFKMQDLSQCIGFASSFRGFAR